MKGLVFPVGWFEVIAPFYPPVSYGLEVHHKVEIVCYQSTVSLSLSLLSTVTFKFPVSL